MVRERRHLGSRIKSSWTDSQPFPAALIPAASPATAVAAPPRPAIVLAGRHSIAQTACSRTPGRLPQPESPGFPASVRLVGDLLKPVMPLFHIPVFVRLTGLDLQTIDPVRAQQRFTALKCFL